MDNVLRKIISYLIWISFEWPSLDFMNETIQLDKIVDNYGFDFFPVNLCPVLINEVQVLHEDEHFYFEFIFVLNKGVLDDNVPLDRCEVNFFLLVFLVCVIDRAHRRIVNQVWLVYEWRSFHRSVDIYRPRDYKVNDK